MNKPTMKGKAKPKLVVAFIKYEDSSEPVFHRCLDEDKVHPESLGGEPLLRTHGLVPEDWLD